MAGRCNVAAPLRSSSAVIFAALVAQACVVGVDALVTAPTAASWASPQAVGPARHRVPAVFRMAQGDDAEGDAKGPRRGARRSGLQRDGGGLPAEPVYAPRPPRHPVSGPSRKRVRAQGKEREQGINNPNKLRVSGGSARGRKLDSPQVFLRPMMGKVKEALYSTLTGFGVFEDENCAFLDLFAGSGSVGIEALSRGAARATFVDLSKDCCEVAMRNAEKCGFGERACAVRGDVMDVLYNPLRHSLTEPYSVVTVTPPYEEVVYADLIKAVTDSDLVREDTLVVVEYPVELGCLPHAIGEGRLVGLRNRRYGRTVLAVYIYRPSGRLDLADSRPEEFVSLR